MGSLTEIMTQGGPVMWPILACAVFGAAIALDRFIFVFFRASLHAANFVAQVQRMVLDGRVDAAIALCNAEPSALLPRVVKAALLRAEETDEDVRDAVEEATLEVAPRVLRRMGFLPMIANVSTLLGLLGTIQGLIQAFHAVDQASGESRSTALAAGIAVAMYTTFAGLFVSIPLLVLHGIVAARANALLDEIDHHGVKVANLLRAVGRARPTGGAPVLPFRG